ncbi:hypothetical protein L6452_19593 [Arctium lappa]|uniref:Uncharacterized protein n=1 Tax=Arctium lappa TaxID=4217 RepID=A0ACB9BAA4_ARCLA|nr:hypothetical protein L6452_19593 [Arctium lappa]
MSLTSFQYFHLDLHLSGSNILNALHSFARQWLQLVQAIDLTLNHSLDMMKYVLARGLCFICPPVSSLVPPATEAMSSKNSENRGKRKYVSLNGTVSTPNHHLRNRGLSDDPSLGEIETFRKLHYREKDGWVNDYSRTSYENTGIVSISWVVLLSGGNRADYLTLNHSLDMMKYVLARGLCFICPPVSSLVPPATETSVLPHRKSRSQSAADILIFLADDQLTLNHSLDMMKYVLARGLCFICPPVSSLVPPATEILVTACTSSFKYGYCTSSFKYGYCTSWLVAAPTMMTV